MHVSIIFIHECVCTFIHTLLLSEKGITFVMIYDVTYLISSEGGEAPILKCPLIGWPCDDETPGASMGDDDVARPTTVFVGRTAPSR